MEEKLTLELLREVKALSRKWFIAFIVVLAMFFVSNLAWLYAWNLPSEETTTSTEVVQDGDNGNNNYIGNDGDINNGKTDNKKDNKNN